MSRVGALESLVLEVLFIAVFLVLAAIPCALVLWLLVYAARAATRLVGVCRHCGYDLRGLGPRRQCPECGRPFQVNARGDVIS